MLIIRFVILLLVMFTLLPMAWASGQFNYYSANPKTQKEIQVVEKNHWEKATNASRQMHYKTAKAELDFILRWIPNHPHALLMLSRLTITNERPEDALSYLDSAINFGPQYEASYIIYGIHLYKSNRIRDSIQKFNAALGINPDSSEANYNIGLAYFAIKDYPRAKVHADKAYNLGYPLPGLRSKLKSVGHWDESGK